MLKYVYFYEGWNVYILTNWHGGEEERKKESKAEHMEVRILKYFVTVVEEKSVTKAARVLHMTQPTLSRQLRQMEDELGVELFQHATKKMTLTNSGMFLYRRAVEILALVEKTEKDLVSREEPLEGRIAIGSGEIEAIDLFADLLLEFHRTYPLVKFDMITGNADKILDRMNRGEVDFGLLMEPINMEKYDFIRLPVKDRYVALMRPDDPLAKLNRIAPGDLIGEPLILPRRSTVHNEVANWLGSEYEKMDILATSNLYTNTAILVSKGLGRAVFIESPLSRIADLKVEVRPLYPPMTTTDVFAWKRQRDFNKACLALMEFVKCFLGI